MPKPVLIVLVLVVLIALTGLALVVRKKSDPGPLAPVDATVRAFTLTAHTGKPFTDADLRGKPVLLYFGYTFCPDICPTELGYLAKVMRALGADAAKATPVFITVDPERDTVAKLAEYVPLFDPHLIGLTGSAADIDALAKAYGVYHQKTVPVSKDPSYYLIDHSSTIFLLDAEGRIADTLDSEIPVAVAAARVRRLMK